MASKGTVRGRIADKEPNPVDVHVGNRIRIRRSMLQYSQQYMARKIGLTFQQVQKYEKGQNRVGASRLWDISKVLNVSMDYFFEDMDETTLASSPMMLVLPDAETDMLKNCDLDAQVDPMKKQETLELVTAYYRIINPKLRADLFMLIKHMSTCNHCLPNDEG